ncbi:excisionase [Staphylococcus caledonicus]|uniref:excisionase n=1 Tax=Staphylococcus caledonicus TaxID=2741333 RepID=UPI0018E4C418|nr:excisionase [Staphylococcus caledonicus]MBI5971987.1 excisionase [Staphylococcus caledonicus]
MRIEFSDVEIAFIKESVEVYSHEFDIYDDENEFLLNLYESIIRKINTQYEDSYLFSVIN